MIDFKYKNNPILMAVMAFNILISVCILFCNDKIVIISVILYLAEIIIVSVLLICFILNKLLNGK